MKRTSSLSFQKNVPKLYYRIELLIKLLHLLSSGSYSLTKKLSQVFTLEQRTLFCYNQEAALIRKLILLYYYYKISVSHSATFTLPS